MIPSVHTAAGFSLLCHAVALQTQGRTPFVCAHGGDATRAPPNTAAAFQAAVNLGADCVEIDAARTKDGELVVLHVRELSQLLPEGSTGLQVHDV